MSAHEEYSNDLEFLNDIDDNFGDFGPLQLLDGAVGDGRRVDFSFLASPKSAPAGAFDPSVGPLAQAHSPGESFKDSASDSSSSKRTGSSVSSKTSPPKMTDVAMEDGLDFKAEWNFDDYLQYDDDGAAPGVSAPGNGTIDPSRISTLGSFGAMQTTDDVADFESPSSGSGDFAIGPADTPSPDFGAQRTAKPPNKKHAKAYSQHSLTQSMSGLKASAASRDVSPTSQIARSHRPSPSAVFHKSPSPGTPLESLTPRRGQSNLAAQWQMMNTTQGFPGQASYVMPGMSQMYAPPVGPSRLWILPAPFKSRVETQIPIRMVICPLPPLIRRVHLQTYTIAKPKLLHKSMPPPKTPDMLELHTMVVSTTAMQNEANRRRAMRRAASATGEEPIVEADEADENDENKPSNGGEVRICQNCITRERKRACRKKNKRAEEEELWDRFERRRVLVWNSHEIQEWKPYAPAQRQGSIDARSPRPEPKVPDFGAMIMEAPLRICCYCRHHSEKLGFQVIFTLKTHDGQVFAQVMSENIMITDDHKAHAMPISTTAGEDEISATSPPQMDSTSPDVDMSVRFGQSQSQPDLPSLQTSLGVTTGNSFSASNPSLTTPVSAMSRNLSRPPSPTGIPGPMAKKRKSSTTPRVPANLTMTRMSAASTPATQPSVTFGGFQSGSTSPYGPNSNLAFSPESLFNPTVQLPGTIPQPMSTAPPTPNHNDQVFFSQANRSTSLDNLAMANQMYSAPTSVNHSRAPSPTGLRNSLNAMQQSQLVHAVAQSFYGSSSGLPTAVNPQLQPTMLKIIPNEGPKSGGVEVTILGRGFFSGLEVKFGDQLATTTTSWGDSTLVCLLPPSSVAGEVPVTFSQHTRLSLPQLGVGKSLTFRYVDDDEQQLIRTALQVIGKKINGSLEDPTDLARRIIGDHNAAWAPNGVGQGQGGLSHSGPGTGGNRFHVSTEAHLLKLLELMDLDDSTHRRNLNLRRKATGQTMLHLACALGFHRFAAGLLARGANPESRDKGGFTPMHMAALNDHPELVRRLVHGGADPTIRSLSGLSVSDVAVTGNTYRAIRRIERHARRSAFKGVLNTHRRISSVNSLRSLWEPQTPTESRSEMETSDYDSEDGSDDSEAELPTTEEDESEEAVESEVDDGPWMQMHARRSPPHRSTRNSVSQETAALMPNASYLTGASNAAAEIQDTALQAHAHAHAQAQDAATAAGPFQSLQQAVALQFQNWPGMPPLPEYAANLYAAQLVTTAQAMRRLAALMPNIGRPGSAGTESQANMPAAAAAAAASKEIVDGRWWDNLALFASSVVAPPSQQQAPAVPPPAYDEIYPAKQAGSSAKPTVSDSKNAPRMDTLCPPEKGAATSPASVVEVQDGDVEEVAGQDAVPATLAAAKQGRLVQFPSLLRIGRKHAITHEQQESLRRAHAERLKGVNSDKNLFLLWIPVIVAIVILMACLSPSPVLEGWGISGSAQVLRTGTRQVIGEVRRRVGNVVQNVA